MHNGPFKVALGTFEKKQETNVTFWTETAENIIEQFSIWLICLKENCG